jgi:drug/metabolite transporter (DMT)-like permease
MNQQKNIYAGIGFAVLATLIWAGNFIIARGVIKTIPPVSLAFYRWVVATIILLPFAWNGLGSAFNLSRKHVFYFLLASATGVTMFNTFVYIAGHYSTAINLALIGTTTSPIIAITLAAIFLKEKITIWKFAGMIVCISGVLLLLSRGNFENLKTFSFSKGDLWILAAALSFAIYNTTVKKKPASMKPVHFLFITFLIGTFLLFPFYLY